MKPILLPILLIVSFGLAICYWAAGCSREEPPSPPEEKKKIVKPIVRPPEKGPKQVAQAKPQDETGKQKQMAGVEPERPTSGQRTAETKTLGPEQPGGKATAGQKTAETKAPGPEQPARKVATGTGTEKGGKGESGYYLVKEEESLSSIAGRKDVLGDPLQWPVLYRLNMDLLGRMGVAADLPKKKLPNNTRLKILTPREMKENSRARTKKYWVINILSAKREEEITPVAVELMKKGYPVYITRVKIKKKDFLRLRVGFFHTRGAAEREGKNIVSATTIKGFWVAKIGEMEHERYTRY
ncbi:MAG: SPOR domain-containing protein [Deltaproteobacteria bacterium]|nr:SPOR domain-containing protein [Deltaproteobacteria bacterium]